MPEFPADAVERHAVELRKCAEFIEDGMSCDFEACHAEAFRFALSLLPDGPRPVPEVKRCPQCNGPVSRVTQSQYSPLNSDQFDAVKAGDWYCRECPGNDRGKVPFCYWWDREVTTWTDADARLAAQHAALDTYLAAMGRIRKGE